MTEPGRTSYVEQVDLLGCRVTVTRWPGGGDRTPILLLNGVGSGADLLAPLAESLRDVEVITFDFPGAGSSRPPLLPYPMAAAAAFTAALLTRLGYPRVDVFGVSWGGTLAQQFAIQHPARCRRLVLAATAAGIPSMPGRPRTIARMLTPRRFNDADYRRRIAGSLYGGSARNDTSVVENLDHAMASISWRGYLYQVLAVLGWSSQPALPLLRQPTLILAGDDDPIIPLVNARWMARLIPDSTLHVIHGGHLFAVSDSKHVAEIMNEFLQQER
ncbi:alpha/beta fold hydrolase [Skermania sp. ID1734]|nr:alpha/beta fold hydrolase [Skermania sp. ID1734]